MRGLLLLRFAILVFIGLTLSSCLVSTSGGSSDHAALINKEQKISAFASANFADLKKDMSSGSGEHLAAFASLLGVPHDQETAFFAFTRERFPYIYPSSHVTAEEMVTALTREMAEHPQFTSFVEKHS